MKRFITFLVMSTVVGLTVVYGEVDAVKTGYRIRKLNLQKRQALDDIREKEYRITELKSPERLEGWMTASRVKLANPKLVKVARLENDILRGREAGSLKPPFVLAKLFLGTAHARSDK